MTGTQRTARHERLRLEIMNYVNENPNCTAAQIAGALSVDKKMRNHGLTARKIGFFIPRFCKELEFIVDARSGCRLYAPKIA